MPFWIPISEVKNLAYTKTHLESFEFTHIDSDTGWHRTIQKNMATWKRSWEATRLCHIRSLPLYLILFAMKRFNQLWRITTSAFSLTNWKASDHLSNHKNWWAEVDLSTFHSSRPSWSKTAFSIPTDAFTGWNGMARHIYHHTPKCVDRTGLKSKPQQNC